MTSARLIAISRPVIDEIPGTPELLAFCARVSSTANQLNHETGSKLLRSLVRRKEWSPLEMVSLTIEIVTTRDIARQILRHRSFSFQEFSQRYAEVQDEFVPRELRMQDQADRQNSIEVDDTEFADWWEAEQLAAAQSLATLYRGAVAKGIAKEVARAVLPEGMTVSRLYMAGTLRSWIHYVQLRADRKTQKEHRLIAERVAALLIGQFPDLAEVIMPEVQTGLPERAGDLADNITVSFPHEYGASHVGHGEAQCKWCFGTNRENAIIDPNHCSARAQREGC